MRRVYLFAVVPVAALLLAGCGSSSSGTATTAASSPAASTPPSSLSAVTSEAPATTASSSADSSAGAAPAGSVIKGGAATKLPTQVGSWVTSKDASGPATIYKRDDATIGVSFLSGSDYNAIVKYIKHMKTKAGTGYCGSTEIKTSLTCYIETIDGVINISADSTEVPLTDLVTFTNQLTAILGTK